MVNWYRSDTLDQMYWHIYNDIVTNGDVRETRGTKSYELSNVAVEQVQNPHLFSLPLLHNKCLSYGELMLIFAAIDELAAYTFYSLAFKQWGEDGKMTGAYGARFSLLEIRRIVNRLKRDRESRRAAIAIYDNMQDINVTGSMIDVACNLSMHFVPRSDCLDLNVFSRSTDFRKGFIYDMGMWSLLLYYVAAATDFRPGTLMFFTSSLHVYEEDTEYLTEHNGECSCVMQPELAESCRVDDLWWLAQNEKNVREEGSLIFKEPMSCPLSSHILLPLIQRARNHKSLKIIAPYIDTPLWEKNEEYYEFAVGSLLEGQR